MMCVLHCDRSGGEAVAFGKSGNLGCIVVCHQEVSGERLTFEKKSFMVDFGVSIKTTACAFSTGGVRWVNKEDGIRFVAMLGERGKGIALHESKSISDMCDVADATGKGRG